MATAELLLGYSDRMLTPEEDRWLRQQSNSTAEISRSIHEHFVSPPLVMQALELFEKRLRAGMESLRVLCDHGRHNFLPDG